MKNFVKTLGLVCLFASSAAYAKRMAVAPPSKAVTKPVLDAIAKEMNRSLAYMRIPGAPKPYFISYKITEVVVNDVAASLGAKLNDRSRNFVGIEAHVRVGDYKFDNGNFVIAQAGSVDGQASLSLPLEADPDLAKKVTWRVTDLAYKEALEQIRAKRDARTAEKIPSYSPEKALVIPNEVLVAPLESVSSLTERAQKISAKFRGISDIRESRVAFTSFLERRWYLNSEGTSATDTRRISGVIVSASTQAPDGHELFDYYSAYGQSFADLPTDKQLEQIAGKLTRQLRETRRAPVADRNYSGPVLFTDVAAAQLLRYGLSPHLTGTPIPFGIAPEEARRYGGELSGKQGLRVLPNDFTVMDDPTSNRKGRDSFIGGFQLDDEGVKSKNVTVIKNGRLVELLHSRTPATETGHASNGHARRSVQGSYHGSATNLHVQTRRALSEKALVRNLVKEVRKQGLEYGLLIEKLDDPAITAAPDFATVELLQLFNATDSMAPPPALIAYKVYPNGKKERVRGLQLKPVDIRSFKRMTGGKKAVTHSFLATTESYLVHKIRTAADGFVPSAGVESSIRTPSLLVEELDVIANPIRRDLPILPRLPAQK